MGYDFNFWCNHTHTDHDDVLWITFGHFCCYPNNGHFNFTCCMLNRNDFVSRLQLQLIVAWSFIVVVSFLRMCLPSMVTAALLGIYIAFSWTVVDKCQDSVLVVIVSMSSEFITDFLKLVDSHRTWADMHLLRLTILYLTLICFSE